MKRIINDRNDLEKRRFLRRNQTSQEGLMWDILRGNKLGAKWKRQVSIGGYVADFYCREKRLVLEIDGMQHQKNKEYDLIREKFFMAVGIKTLRFLNSEIDQDLKKVRAKIIDVMNSLESWGNLQLV